jgi:hypothetical protein
MNRRGAGAVEKMRARARLENASRFPLFAQPRLLLYLFHLQPAAQGGSKTSTVS